MKNVNPIHQDIFKRIGRIADDNGVEAYIIGGYVRDYFLNRECKDIDIVVVGSGIEIAEILAQELKTNLSVFKSFGTAMLRTHDIEIEFVGARKESYRIDSRKPIVEDGTFSDDISRRDFTINTLAFGLNAHNFGELIDTYNGIEDLHNKILKTPLDPDTTFSDDPLRMIRAIRFATQLNFTIVDETFEAIKRNAHRIEIVSKERIITELDKIMMSKKPSLGFYLFDQSGLLELILKDVHRLKGVEKVGNRAHKDNFIHTLKVLDNVAEKSNNIWLRYAALFHDIAKPRTKAWDEKVGWTFHGHETLGSKMVNTIFRHLKMPLNDKMKYVQKLVFLHLRPIILAEDIVTDSAVRRLLFEAGDDVEDLMTLCEADITSGNDYKVKKYLRNFEIVRQKMKEIEEKDRIRNFQPPITGEDIMKRYNIKPSNVIGDIKIRIKDAILDGKIENDYNQAYAMMEEIAKEYGLE
ncbi:MAG: CCA tRNA nucleotidyltransferase [Rikenellaceae bacterium]